MNNNTGSNIQNVKSLNRILVLKYIATNKGISRVDIARHTGLSKMTIGNIVGELLSVGLVVETDELPSVVSSGRRPILLTLSNTSPCICGILIKRELCQIVLSDLGGNIFFHEQHLYTILQSPQDLLHIISDLFEKCRCSTERRILAIGISCVGPLDSANGTILNPPFFYGIENIPIVSILEEMTGLPAFLVNDATSGALSEKLYGIGAGITNFAYLHIMNGIGAGFVLNGALYDGDSGQSGEIGHTSIHFDGPRCACGNRGCLDLYANVEHMRDRIHSLSAFYPDSPLSHSEKPKWHEIVTAGNHRDPLALIALEEFCSYVAHSLVNTLNLLNLSTIIVGYSSNNDGTIIEELLALKLNTLSLSAKYQPISVIHSTFDGDAPLVGSVAFVVDKIFNRNIPLAELEVLLE